MASLPDRSRFCQLVSASEGPKHQFSRKSASLPDRTHSCQIVRHPGSGTHAQAPGSRCPARGDACLRYRRRSTPRTRLSKSAAWRSASSSTLWCVTEESPLSFAASVRPSTFMPSACAMITSHTVDMPT